MLALYLHVDDESFSSTSIVSPFPRRNASVQCLQVCKAWARIGAPLFYHTVVLDSGVTVAAVAAAFKRNPSYGAYTRRLRVETQYGCPLKQITRLMTNVDEFVFSLAIWTDTQTTGLRQTLSLLNPRRVTLTMAPQQRLMNQNHNEILHYLCERIVQWSRLVCQPNGCGSRTVNVRDRPDFPSLDHSSAEVNSSRSRTTPSIKLL